MKLSDILLVPRGPSKPKQAPQPSPRKGGWNRRFDDSNPDKWIIKYWDKNPQNDPVEQPVSSKAEAQRILDALPASYAKAMRPAIGYGSYAARGPGQKGGVYRPSGKVREEAELTEGAYVVKNLDGKEKRFKSWDSPEANEWRKTSAPKKVAPTKLVKYSDAWWDEKNWTGDYEGVMPDKKITDNDLSFGKLAASMKDEMSGGINDFHVMSGGHMKVGDTTVATARVRITYEFDMKDMGYDDETIASSGNQDGKGMESVYVKVRRDEKKPENIIFVGYSG